MNSSGRTPPPRPPSHSDAFYARFPTAGYGDWCATERDDPVTGLVAWPGFYRRFPDLLARALNCKRAVGIAIGDVDDLKGYVESTRAGEPRSFGHLAGNAFMTRLGEIARTWLYDQQPSQACLATFGGDEIILAAEADGQEQFGKLVTDLRDLLGELLPRSVSFAYTVVHPPAAAASPPGGPWWCDFTDHVLLAVERALFDGKHARREGERASVVEADGPVVVVGADSP